MTAAVLEQATSRPRRRERLTPELYVDRYYSSSRRTGRRDKTVLKTIASHASWNAWDWGEDVWAAAATIAAEAHYCERSVRYAFKNLIEDGWLVIDARPGRTNLFTVVRADPRVDVLPPVEDLRRRRSKRAGGAARNAAKHSPSTEVTPPEGPPSRGEHRNDGADAPADAAPDAPRPRPAPDPPATAGAESGPRAHRGDAAAGRAAEPAGPSPGGPPAEPSRSVPGVPTGFTRGVTPRRDAARRSAPCPACGAKPGEACRGRGGRLRLANHGARQPTAEAYPQLELAVAPRPRRPDWCGECDHPDSRHVEGPAGWMRCPTCHPLADGGPAP